MVSLCWGDEGMKRKYEYLNKICVVTAGCLLLIVSVCRAVDLSRLPEGFTLDRPVRVGEKFAVDVKIHAEIIVEWPS